MTLYFTNIHWYVDAFHQMHDDCKGHIGSLLTFGKVVTTSLSTKQKVPSKSSSKSEIISLYDKSSNILWTQHFLEAQVGAELIKNYSSFEKYVKKVPRGIS
jgi:hypothetical protein